MRRAQRLLGGGGIYKSLVTKILVLIALLVIFVCAARYKTHGNLQPIMADDAKEIKNILQKFTQILEISNLTYMMYGGTLLGSCRHHGRIPWDDDVDLLINGSQKEQVRSVFQSHSSEFHLYAGGDLFDIVRGVTFWKFYSRTKSFMHEKIMGMKFSGMKMKFSGMKWNFQGWKWNFQGWKWNFQGWNEIFAPNIFMHENFTHEVAYGPRTHENFMGKKIIPGIFAPVTQKSANRWRCGLSRWFLTNPENFMVGIFTRKSPWTVISDSNQIRRQSEIQAPDFRGEIFMGKIFMDCCLHLSPVTER